jgi:hypothetical protein
MLENVHAKGREIYTKDESRGYRRFKESEEKAKRDGALKRGKGGGGHGKYTPYLQAIRYGVHPGMHITYEDEERKRLRQRKSAEDESHR